MNINPIQYLPSSKTHHCFFKSAVLVNPNQSDTMGNCPGNTLSVPPQEPGNTMGNHLPAHAASTYADSPAPYPDSYYADLPRTPREPMPIHPQPEPQLHQLLTPQDADQRERQIQAHKDITDEMKKPDLYPAEIETEKGSTGSSDSSWSHLGQQDGEGSDAVHNPHADPAIEPSSPTSVKTAVSDAGSISKGSMSSRAKSQHSSSTFFEDLGHHIDVFVDTVRGHLKEYWMWYLIAMIVILIIALLLWHRKRLMAMCKSRRVRRRQEMIEDVLEI